MLHLLNGLFERIPTFMSSYIPRLMYILLDLSGKKDDSAHLIEARNTLLQTITEKSTTESCVESLSSCWTKVKHTRKVCLFAMLLTLDY